MELIAFTSNKENLINALCLFYFKTCSVNKHSGNHKKQAKKTFTYMFVSAHECKCEHIYMSCRCCITDHL